MKTVFLCSLLVLAASGVFAADLRPVQIQVNADRPANYILPRTLFGSFLEPIGNSTYNGLWAELVQNGSLEENLWSASNVARMIQDEPTLAQASRLGLPLPWEPLYFNQGNRYEARWGEAANSWRSLEVLGVPGKETGVRQKIFLPVQRELKYAGSFYAKHISGPNAIDISLRRRNHPEEIFDHMQVEAGSADWRKYQFNLTLKPGQVARLEPVDLVVQVKGDERSLLDLISLMPVDAIDGLDPEMVQLSKNMKTPLVRFGGNFTSAYHWRDGVGPRDKRISMLNIAWGIPEYNQFGTDEFLRFCDLIGAQPQIALNLGSGTPQEAADWVQYVNQHWKEHGGLLWELGNELWGNWNLGSPTLEELPKRTAEFNQAIRQVDPQARLIATGQDPDVYQQWNAAQLTDPRGTFDYLSTHFVVTTDRTKMHNASPDFVAEASFALPVELGHRLRAMQAQINESGKFRNKAHLAFTEWLFACCNADVADAPRFDNMGGAIETGGFFNMLLQNADIVPISDMTGIIEFAGIWKKRGQVYATPSYYAFQLYSSADIHTPVAVRTDSVHYNVHGGVTRLPDIMDVPYLEVTSALNAAGDRLTLFCVNRNLTQDLPATISLNGFAAKPQAVIQSLSASSIYEVNNEMRPQAITPLSSSAAVQNNQLNYTFRHESVTRIELTKQ